MYILPPFHLSIVKKSFPKIISLPLITTVGSLGSSSYSRKSSTRTVMSKFHFPLNDLPTEILLRIISFLVRKDLKTLRSMNRRVCALASEKMFESLTICTNDASYIQLLNVVTHQVWAAQVRHIDWVVLSETKRYLNVTQEITIKDISSFGSWTDKLEPRELLISNEWVASTFNGLELQCRLVQRLYNVQTVRFWCWNECHGEGRAPWRDQTTRSGRILGSTFRSEGPCRGLKIYSHDVSQILHLSKLKPNHVMALKDSVFLTYAIGGEIDSLQVMACCEDLVRCKRYNCTSHDLEKYCLAAIKEEENGRCIGWADSSFLFAMHDIKTLKSLKISSANIYLADLDTVLTRNVQLEFFHMYNTSIYADDFIWFSEAAGPVLDLLHLLKNLHCGRDLDVIKITLENVMCGKSFGRFSASEQEVRTWIQGKNTKLLASAKSAFYVMEESSNDSES